MQIILRLLEIVFSFSSLMRLWSEIVARSWGTPGGAVEGERYANI